MDTGSIAWMLTASMLVLFMTPGLAFFYGGLVRGRNVVSTLMYSFIAMGVASIVWVLWGYSLAFDAANNIGWMGGLGYIGLSNLEAFPTGEGCSRPALRDLPDDIRDHHPGADHRRVRRTVQVHDVPAVLGFVVDLRLLPDLLLGMGRWLDRRHRRGGLRRRNRRSH